MSKEENVLVDVLVRVIAIERLLLEKKVFTQEEYEKSIDAVAAVFAESVLRKAGASEKDILESLNKFKGK